MEAIHFFPRCHGSVFLYGTRNPDICFFVGGGFTVENLGGQGCGVVAERLSSRCRVQFNL